MIYVSSSCVKHNKIKDSVKELIDNGFKNIELSGGTENYDGLENDLLELKYKYDLNYICHNYFPPPKEHFVLNLASLNKDIFKKTFRHLQEAIRLSKRLGAMKFGFHAGFFIDIKISEIGKKISKESLYNKEEAEINFYESFNLLRNEAENLDLYIENNVFSSTNFETFNGENFFMLTNYKEYEQMKEKINFKLLLDIAHLKVSSKTLGLNFENELINMIANTDYIHISDNDSFHDLNNTLKRDSHIIQVLKNQNLNKKHFTLEIYDNIKNIKKSYEILSEVLND